MEGETPNSNRREFLIGRAFQRQLERAGEVLADEVAGLGSLDRSIECGPIVRLGKQAMACDFEILLNPGPARRLTAASEALDLIDELEAQLSVYRVDSEVSRLNCNANQDWVEVESQLYQLLSLASQISLELEGGYDITSGPLITLWKTCKSTHRLPTEAEIAAALEHVGMHHLEWSPDRSAVRFSAPPMSINLGSIGKGYALDRAGDLLRTKGITEFLFHGGKSSLLARGRHGDLPGWPVGIAHPFLPDRNVLTIVLQDQGLSTSGSNVQYFRLGGRRFGHILDPRTGWPVEQMASVTVLAPSAALAEALSTAFFVVGVEKAREYCHNHPDVKALLIPTPEPGQQLRCVNCGVGLNQLLCNDLPDFQMI